MENQNQNQNKVWGNRVGSHHWNHALNAVEKMQANGVLDGFRNLNIRGFDGDDEIGDSTKDRFHDISNFVGQERQKLSVLKKSVDQGQIRVNQNFGQVYQDPQGPEEENLKSVADGVFNDEELSVQKQKKVGSVVKGIFKKVADFSKSIAESVKKHIEQVVEPGHEQVMEAYSEKLEREAKIDAARPTVDMDKLKEGFQGVMNNIMHNMDKVLSKKTGEKMDSVLKDLSNLNKGLDKVQKHYELFKDVKAPSSQQQKGEQKEKTREV